MTVRVREIDDVGSRSRHVEAFRLKVDQCAQGIRCVFGKSGWRARHLVVPQPHGPRGGLWEIGSILSKRQTVDAGIGAKEDVDHEATAEKGRGRVREARPSPRLLQLYE
jgi:hypothetical protein